MKLEVDIEARIRELRAVLRVTRSEDVQRTIEEAISDCEKSLAELEGDPVGRARAEGAPWSLERSGARPEGLRPILTNDC